MKIAIGTTNPAKINAVKKGFECIDSQEVIFESHKTESNVSEQPFSDEETITGALNRAKNVLQKAEADIGIGLEGGVTETEFGLFLCNWGALADKYGNEITAGGARIKLPNEIAIRLKDGEELGPVMDDYTKRNGIRHKEGAVGVFTNGLITRDEMFQHVVKLLIGQWQYEEGR
jgi:inosine/xanthosine triphosphatase